MEQVMVVTLIIALITGFSQEQNLLPPGPINGEVGKSVLFNTIPSAQPIRAIRWTFKGIDVVTYSEQGSVSVYPTYIGRVLLNSSSGELTLQKLTFNDSGQYNVIITFQSGIGYPDNTILQVFEPVLIIGIRGPVGNLFENHNATFTCEGNGTITTTLWKKGLDILAPSSSITFLDNNRTVVFSSLKRSDSGNYQCVMSNPLSNAFAGYSITVNYGPDVRILGVQTLEEGSDILLLCSPDSFPPVTVSWTVKGMSAGNTPLYVKENSNPSDSGDYSCTCMNNVTGIKASAVNILTVKPVSSRLGPGAEAGITLGVIFAVVILPVLIFFLVKHFKKPAGPVRNTPAPNMNAGSNTTPEISNTLQINGNYVNTQHNKPPIPPPREKNTQDSGLYSRTIQ